MSMSRLVGPEAAHDLTADTAPVSGPRGATRASVSGAGCSRPELSAAFLSLRPNWKDSKCVRRADGSRAPGSRARSRWWGVPHSRRGVTHRHARGLRHPGRRAGLSVDLPRAVTSAAGHPAGTGWRVGTASDLLCLWGPPRKRGVREPTGPQQTAHDPRRAAPPSSVR